MITGLQIDIPAAELKALLNGRLDYHSSKVKVYSQQLVDLKKVTDEMEKERELIGKTSNASPADNLARTVERHRNQTIYFKFMAEHVVASETYRLSETDLQRLGIQSQDY